jgi:cell division septation protein DedD
MKNIAVLILLFVNTASLNISHYVFAKEANVYSIHLFTLKNSEEANAKVKEFKDRGYNAFFREEKSGDREKVFNVYVERFNTKPEAEKEARVLKDLDLITDYDVRDISEKGRPEATGNKKDKETEKFNNIISNNEPAKVEKSSDKANTKSNKVEGSKAGKVPVQKDKVFYYLKVSSLKEKANAEEEVSALQKAGYQAFYKLETLEGRGDWYRVYMDGYQSREEAKKDGIKLLASGVISGYEILKEKRDLQPPKVLQDDSKKAYFLHVASFKDSAKADEEVRRLTGLGLKAVSNSVEISGEQWIRVYAGEFSTEKEAREKGTELIQKGVVSYFKPMLMDKAIEPDPVHVE